ncbi:MAG: hypothetical protein Ct9H90mP15_09160 [Candidatus Neomarinimicrobiota bacterium]|nr:MAG: hypothetical protein Ct9H90mP15_09160 [Candidatus Neomarinimicrobiota bacterium]
MPKYRSCPSMCRPCICLLGFFTNFVYLILGHTIIALIVASIFSLRFNQARTAR